MGFFNRVSRLIKGNVNAALDKATDPAKEVELLVRQMEEALPKARGETARSMAAVKQAERRIEELSRERDRWAAREAQVPADDEELGRQVAERRGAIERDLGEARRERREAAELAEQQRAALGKLESRLRLVRARTGTIQAKLGAAKGYQSSTEAFDDFERMAGKVDSAEGAIEAEAEVAAALDGGRPEAEVARDVERRGKEADLDARLAELKKKLET
jgi:phage shock protein A